MKGIFHAPFKTKVYIVRSLIVLRECVSLLVTSTKFLTVKLLKQVYRYHKICISFSKFYHRHSELSSALLLCLTVPRVGLQCVIVLFSNHTTFFFGLLISLLVLKLFCNRAYGS